jgi:choline dehydrogenase-like flavoprotein
MTFDSDCIVIGSGPAGVSATFPLAESGLHVLMLDGARDADADAAKGDAREPWKRMLGGGLEALLPQDGLSPKLRTPAARQVIGGFHRANDIRGDGFVVVGSQARGGLSRIWGGLVCEFDAKDIEGWPIPIEDMRRSYRTVTDRIGVCGSDLDEMADFFGRSGTILPPLPVGPSAAHLLNRYHPGSQGAEFRLGVARNAILTLARGARGACDLRKDCLWGCDRGAIYDARFDLDELKQLNTFRLVDNAHAAGLAQVPGGWQVLTQDGRRFAAPRVVIAAGTLGTAALVIPLLPNATTELRLLSNPVVAMPILVPRRLGQAAAVGGFSLAQLGYRLRYGPASLDYISGAVYEVEGLPSSSFTARLPFGRRAGSELFNAISSALLVATAYFPGAESDNRLRWQRNGNGMSIVVRGNVTAGLSTKVNEVIHRLRRTWRKLGALMLPGASLAQPGTDVHIAGLFPMGTHAPHGTSENGELVAAPGVFAVDGSVLPTLPSKYVTLTIMANADRIGRYIAQRQRTTSGSDCAN